MARHPASKTPSNEEARLKTKSAKSANIALPIKMKATEVHRNSISRAAAVSVEPNNPSSHHRIHSQPIVNIPTLPGAHRPRNKSGSGLGLGIPSTSLPHPTKKRHHSTSDVPSTSGATNHKKTKVEVDLTKPEAAPEFVKRCHQCRLEVRLEDILSCSFKEPVHSNANNGDNEPSKLSANPDLNASSASRIQNPGMLQKPCRKNFCRRCLASRYGEDLKKIRPTLKSPYKWNCPACMDYCNCSGCRKKKGLLPTGKLDKLVTEAGCMSARDLLEANPNIQGPDFLIQVANRREKEKNKLVSTAPQTSTTQSKTKPDDESSNQPSSKPKPSSSKATSSTKKTHPNDDHPAKSNQPHVEKTSNKLQKELKVTQNTTQKSKKQHQSSASDSKKKSTAHPNSAPPESNKKSGSNDVIHNNKNEQPKKTDEKSENLPQPVPSPPPKIPARRAPNIVQPPGKIYNLPTARLSSSEILKRINIREFVSRFKEMIPGLGGTEPNKSGGTARSRSAESERASKILDSMDDLTNFWIDDEGGMRAIMNGLVRLIEVEIDSDSDQASSRIFKSEFSLPLLVQLKRESRFAVVPSPYLQSSVPCWITATNLLKSEGLETQLEEDIRNGYLSSSSSPSTSTDIPDPTLINDDRLQKVKFPPVNKSAVISGLIEIALRCHTLADDFVLGVERERQAKAEIVKERAKLNKQWTETKAKKNATVPMKESLLIVPPADGKKEENGEQKMIKNPSQSMLDQESARVQALAEWQADMNQAEVEYKNELRKSFADQYAAECSNRLRFQSIGQDAGERKYYILSSTPGRVYPRDPIELDYAWSYNMIIHGAELVNGKKGKLKQKKPMEAINERVGDEKNDGGADGLVGDEIRAGPNDQWLRVSDPAEIRQLASWIEYQAKLIDFKNSLLNQTSADGDHRTSPLNPPSAPNHNEHGSASVALKNVANLVDQILRFADLVQFKIHLQHESLGHSDRRNHNKSTRNPKT